MNDGNLIKNEQNQYFMFIAYRLILYGICIQINYNKSKNNNFVLNNKNYAKEHTVDLQ